MSMVRILTLPSFPLKNGLRPAKYQGKVSVLIFSDSVVLAAHSHSLDFNFLARALERCGLTLDNVRFSVNTLKLAGVAFPNDTDLK